MSLVELLALAENQNLVGRLLVKLVPESSRPICRMNKYVLTVNNFERPVEKFGLIVS